ncbi:MAG TPA: LemA family protein [Solirubrobacterales bacterium]|jgi:LemA protein|nr:LemA family protein [Solirubrobacterales bacterium]
MVVAIIVIAVLLLIGLFYILIRNSIIGSRNRVDESWSGIDVQLKRRHDLVPNLVETVRGYATHERETFEKVTQARAAAMQADGPAQASAAEGMLSQALGGLRVVAEQYPELRATENFQQLSRNLSELEDEIQASRRIYNSNVQAYNTKIQVFPNSVVASSGGFTAREFFEIEDPGDREVPTFSFDGGATPAAAPAPPAAGSAPPPSSPPPAAPSGGAPPPAPPTPPTQ